MGRPTKATNPLDQLKLERKGFETRMRPKPVLAERIKRREERELKKQSKVFVDDVI